MGVSGHRDWSAAAWELQRRQHGVVTHAQLVGIGLSGKAIQHRLHNGRLHPLTRGVYAVGRPQVGGLGRWMAAVLACGPEALLSHRSAAVLWGIRRPEPGLVDVVVPPHVGRRRSGIRVHRLAPPRTASTRPPWPYRMLIADIPVTCPAAVVVDLSASLPLGQVEAAVNEADQLGLIDPETLRGAIDAMPWRPGATRLAALLDAAELVLTTTELERLFLPLVERAGLPLPEGQRQVGRNRVDFIWPRLGLVVEADSLRYHRTAFKQGRDKRRDNENVRRGLATLRFSHGQINSEPKYVCSELRAVAKMLSDKLGEKAPS